MTRNAFLSITIISAAAIFQIDARAFLGSFSVLTRELAGPLTFEPSKSHSNPVKLARDESSACPVRSDSGISVIGKRQTSTSPDNIIPTAFTGDNLPTEEQNVFIGSDNAPEAFANAAPESQADGSENNVAADNPDADGVVNGDSTAEGDISPDEADINRVKILPDVTTVAARQRPGDGRPIDGYPLDGCYEGPDDAYAVHLMEFQTYPPGDRYVWRNPRAILVSDLVLPLDLRYDVTIRGGKLVYQKLPAQFMRGNEIVPIGLYDFRGWLVAQGTETKEDALRWFEGIASAPLLIARAKLRDRPGIPTTTWWTKEVLDAMDKYAMGNEKPPYWVPWHVGEA